MKTILLTGATGFLGSHLLKNFLNKNEYSVIILKRSFSDTNRITKELKNKNTAFYNIDEIGLEKVFQNRKIDIVVHCAVIYGRNGETVTDMLKTNVLFPLELLTLSKKYNIELFINTDSILAPSINAYSMTKHNIADWLNLFVDDFKIANVRLDHFYGANDSSIKFVSWLVQEMKNNVQEINLTDGSQKRDFIYIDDVVSAYNCIISNINKLRSNQINTFEVGTNIKTSVRELVNIIYENIKPQNTKLNFGVLPYRKNEVLDYDISTTSLRLLGWAPVYNVEAGIKKLLDEENDKDIK